MATLEWDIDSSEHRKNKIYEQAMARRDERIRYIRQRFGLSQDRMRDDFREAFQRAQQRQMDGGRDR